LIGFSILASLNIPPLTVDEDVIRIPQAQITLSESSTQISWIKSNAGWWAEQKISDDDFVKGIQWLISNGIMRMI